ncbi:MAG: UDP-galactopyranose mutase [Lachnospiraceae bacterium]|nr:UDP-galactopyranose mutase [Lachnospiraceae bacterium]
MKYDYLIVGAGLFGAVFAHEMKAKGKRCLVIEKRPHIAGNIYTEPVHGIQVHKYGAHIFHTSDKKIWDYVNRFAEFNHYINSPVAVYRDELYNLPFNMNTFSRMWGIRTPAEAKARIAEQIAELGITEPNNLEEQALSLVGRDVYEKLVKGYTEKQWGRECRELPAFIIKRLPLRFVYDNNYFNDPYQGIPKGGYTQIVEKLLAGTEVLTGTEYRDYVKGLRSADGTHTFEKILFTGMIDEYFDYQLGALEYRSLRFEQDELMGVENYQGNAVVNYTERNIPYTRIIEHKHFEFGTQPDTVITREYPVEWHRGEEPYYPVNNEKNDALYVRYCELAAKEKNVLFGGRLGQYKYYDMDKVIAAALQMAEEQV